VDCAICTNSFHHYLDPPKVLAEIRSLISHGCTLTLWTLRSASRRSCLRCWVPARRVRNQIGSGDLCLRETADQQACLWVRSETHCG
jgi:hypothetical protein